MVNTAGCGSGGKGWGGFEATERLPQADKVIASSKHERLASLARGGEVVDRGDGLDSIGVLLGSKGLGSVQLGPRLGQFGSLLVAGGAAPPAQGKAQRHCQHDRTSQAERALHDQPSIAGTYLARRWSRMATG